VTAVGAGRTSPEPQPGPEPYGEPGAEARTGAEPQAERDRRRITAALALPVLLLSLVPALEFDHWQWLCMALTAPIATWGAWPCHRAALVDLARGSGGGHSVVSLSVLAAFGWSVYALYGTGAGDVGSRLAFSTSFEPGAVDTAPLYFAVAAGVPAALFWLRRTEIGGRAGASPRERLGVVGAFVTATPAVAAATLGFWLGAGAEVGGAAGAAVGVLVGAGPCVLGLVGRPEGTTGRPDRFASATALACTAVGLPLAVSGRLGSLQAGLLVVAAVLLAALNSRRSRAGSAAPVPAVEGRAEYVLLPTRVRAVFIAGAAAAACVLLLAAFTGSGAAGRPAAPTETVEVTDARVLLPTNPDNTAALFTLRNPGTRDNALVLVSSPDLAGTLLTRTEVTVGAGRMRTVPSVTVPAGGSLRMSPFGLDVMVLAPPPLKLGDRVRFDLWFREGGRVRVNAVTVRPGT
jgi:copper(I)-binding protein